MNKFMTTFIIFILGAAFGLVLSRSGATDYNFIQHMFLFTDFQLYGIIGAAVAVTAPGLWLLRKRGKTVSGEPIKVPPKPLHWGNVVGGALFGIGWSITGMCPGPIVVNIGEGKLYALGAFAGVIAGSYLVGTFYPVLRRWLGLPEGDAGCG